MREVQTEYHGSFEDENGDFWYRWDFHYEMPDGSRRYPGWVVARSQLEAEEHLVALRESVKLDSKRVPIAIG